MLKLETILSNIKSDLLNFKWTSTSGLGESQFQGVYTFPNWENLVGYPFLCAQIINSIGTVDTNKAVRWVHTLELHVCVNWSAVEGMDDTAKREEATARLIEATQALREYVVKDTTVDTWANTTDGWVNDYEIRDANIFDLNLYRKIVILKLNDITTKL